MNTPSFPRHLALMAFLFCFQITFAQSGPKWATDGNATSNSDFIGTTNANWLFFRTNNIPWMSLNTTGTLRLNSLAGSGIGFASLDANGNLMRTNFTNDPTQVLTGDGTFNSISTLSGWKIVGNEMFNLNSGFVGIGTYTPQYLLDVNGDARVNGTLYALGLVLATKMQADTMKSTNMISVNNNLNFTAGLLNEIYTFNGDIRLQSRLGYNGNTILNAGTNGNVGVGTYNPLAKLDVNGNMRVNGTLNFPTLATGVPMQVQIDANGNLVPIPPITTFCNGTSVIDWNTRGNSNTDESVDFLGTCDQVPLVFRTSNLERMRISATGNVGIGMSTPQFPLDVCGTIHAKEVRVNTTGCDFVFDSTYALLPMDSLQHFVSINKHLPGIPTATQMETTDGVALGQLNSLYLMKIEELTLYMIQLKEQNDTMQKEIEELKKR